MNAYDLPTSLTIGGVVHPIRYGWRAIMDIFSVINDPDFDDEVKTFGILKIFYPKWREIPEKDIQEAIKKACEFIDCGQTPEEKNTRKIIDWEQDAPILIPAINQVAKQEIRSNRDIHWWTVFGWFMGIDDNLFSTVINIRQKKMEGKKLEKWEQDFYRKNRNLVDLKQRYSAEDRATQEYFNKWL